LEQRGLKRPRFLFNDEGDTMWNRIKKFFGGSSEPEQPEIPLIKAEDNEWKVQLVDVRPISQTMLSYSKNKECAENSISYHHYSGSDLAKLTLPSNRVQDTNFRFKIDASLVNGALFIPAQMEHKWALFYQDQRILFVRSWMRTLNVSADVECKDGYATIRKVRGEFAEGEEPEMTLRILNYLMRTHAMSLKFPAPLPLIRDQEAYDKALLCFNLFGNMAPFATDQKIPFTTPDEPLRTDSLFHCAIASGDLSEMDRYLSEGVSAELKDKRGFTTMQLAMDAKQLSAAVRLLECGCDVDVGDYLGATALMHAVQKRSVENVAFLLKHGADANAGDVRGFTALHRAAEMGLEEIVCLLLQHKADPRKEAEGHTPLSLAEKRNEKKIVQILKATL